MTDPQRWTLVLNGKAANDDALRAAVATMRARGVSLDVRVTWEDGDALRHVEEAIAHGAQVVVAGGGDGTLSQVADALARQAGDGDALPSLALVPMGTANDFATAAGLPEAPLEAFELIAAHGAHPVDLIALAADGQRRWAVNLASAGFGTQVTVETPEGMKKLLGGLAYLLTGLSKLGRIEPVEAVVQGPGFAWRGGFIALGIGNGRQAGGGQALCPEALVDDGLLDVTIVPELDGQVATTLGAVVAEGKAAALDRVAVRTRLPWLELEATAPMTINLDGEPVEARRFRLECVARRLRMHLPPDCPLRMQPGRAPSPD